MVKFAKNGSDVTTAAVRLARAVTGRGQGRHLRSTVLLDRRLVHRDHRRWTAGSRDQVGTRPFAFATTILIRFRHVFDRTDDQSPASSSRPRRQRLNRNPASFKVSGGLCDRHGTLLIFDEMITGFRWSAHGAQSLYGSEPDLSCWGKAMGNGFPMSALAGKREFMELGGLNTDRERVFLLSTTHGPESGSLAAFRAVVKAYATDDPIGQHGMRWAAAACRGVERGHSRRRASPTTYS